MCYYDNFQFFVSSSLEVLIVYGSTKIFGPTQAYHELIIRPQSLGEIC